MQTHAIRLQSGFGELIFGASCEEAELKFGLPTETEVLEGPDQSQTLVWHYWDAGFSLFFDRQEQDRFSCVEIDAGMNPLLWDQPLQGISEQDLKSLFLRNGFFDIDEERHEWGEKRISFDDAMADFYFENGKLISINFGVLLKSSEMKLFSN